MALDVVFRDGLWTRLAASGMNCATVSKSIMTVFSVDKEERKKVWTLVSELKLQQTDRHEYIGDIFASIVEDTDHDGKGEIIAADEESNKKS